MSKRSSFIAPVSSAVDALVSSVCHAAGSRYPHPQLHGHVAYGTAGFRMRADSGQMEYIMFRMGVLAALRSRSLGGRAVGIMVTASHNPEHDNGVKLVEPNGDMLPVEWEPVASGLVNSLDSELRNHLHVLLSTLHGSETSAAEFVARRARVLIGRDSRQTSPGLADAAAAGVRACTCHADCGDGEGQATVAELLGELTTPQLHYIVACSNNPSYGLPSRQGYAEKLAGAFVRLAERRQRRLGRQGPPPQVCVDAANGVGAGALAQLAPLLGDHLRLAVHNRGEGQLNYRCGADYVKVKMRFPEGQGLAFEPGQRWASFDGDADRIVYFYSDSEGHFQMLDGDKQAALIAGYLIGLTRAAGLQRQLTAGLVQTAYANAASTSYLAEQMGVQVACESTGVKHLHRRAKDFDIGVYFEANGHGTVLFSERARSAIEAATANGDGQLSEGDATSEAARELRLVMDLINETVGDAVSILLTVEHALAEAGWGAAEWNACYTDLPSRQLKVTVANRAVVTTADAERRCVLPAGLQPAIDRLVAGTPRGRAFVRPSGTEDVVRVYAEGETRELADRLALEVAGAVYQLAGGVGPYPAID